MRLEQSEYLGTTKTKYEFDSYVLSIVNFHTPVYEGWHYHENTHFSLVLQGGSRESRRKDDFQLTPGKIVLYNEGELHCNQHTVFPSKHLIVELKKEFHTTDKLDTKRFSRTSAEDLDTQLDLLNIYSEIHLGDVYSAETIDFSFHQLLQAKDTSSYTPMWVLQLKEIIEDRWNEFVPLNELAAAFNVHPATISKYFKRYYNCTLGDYMRKIKIQRAFSLLMDTNIPLSEISDICGFTDQSHMIKIFKHYIGFLPSQIRTL